MDSLGNAAAIASPLVFLRINTPVRQPLRSRVCFCSGKDENSTNLFRGPSQIKLEGHNVDILEESFSPSERGLEMNNSDIWKLFNDAQRNILYLNKHRLMAIEELNKIQRENQSLLKRIEQLEAGNQRGVVEGIVTESTESPSFCQLLLRIDSMVLSGIIGTGEATDLRKKVMDNKIMIHDTFYGIQQKNDMELLSELRQFSEKTIREKLLIAPYGFDGMKWDPSKDKFLPAKYSADNIEGKAVCKVALRHHVGFSGRSFAIVGCIYSEVSDIDMGNLRVAVLHALRKGAQFIFMGPKVPVTDTALQAFQDELKDINVRFINKYDEALSHLILAGSDIILCSSFHDPMFQIPLKAIKYGSAPVSINLRNDGFRQSEGHVHDCGSTMLSQYILSTFANMSLSQALDEIRNEPSRWVWRIKDGMSRDFSWDAECCDVHWAAYESIKNL